MIGKSKCGCLARVKKQNEIIDALNPLLNIELVDGSELMVHYSDDNVVLTIPGLESVTNFNPDGYDPEIWEELDLDVCISGTVTTKTFLVKK